MLPKNVSLRVAVTQLRLRSSMPHWRASKRAGRLRAVIKILHNYSMQKMRVVGILRVHE